MNIAIRGQKVPAGFFIFSFWLTWKNKILPKSTCYVWYKMIILSNPYTRMAGPPLFGFIIDYSETMMREKES